jgi:hypothetical protein
MAYLQVSPLGGSRDETWRGQGIRKRSVSWNLPKLSQLWRCNGGFGPRTTQNHLRTKQFVSGTWNSSRVAACALRNEQTGRGTYVLPYATWFIVCGRNLITGLTSAASARMDISSTCKVEQKLGVSLPLLTCSPSAWPSRLLCRRGRKSRKDLWITLYITLHVKYPLFWSVFNNTWIFSTDFRKIIKYQENSSSGNRVLIWG